MESKKITKKELMRIGEFEEGYYFTGNVYNYENVIEYVSRLLRYTETGTKETHTEEAEEAKKDLYKNINKEYINSMNDLINNIEKMEHDNFSINQLYYSAGIYGNSGQLHRLKIYNNNEVVAIYTLYY